MKSNTDFRLLDVYYLYTLYILHFGTSCISSVRGREGVMILCNLIMCALMSGLEGRLGIDFLNLFRMSLL